MPSWGRPCGIAEYVRGLAWGLGELGQAPEILPHTSDLHRVARDRGINAIHFQHEYSLWHPHHLRREALNLARAGITPLVTVHAFGPAPDHNTVLKDCFPLLLVHSEAMKREMATGLGISEARVKVMPMGVHPYNLPDREAVRAELGLGNSPAIGFVGFFYPQKGIIELGLAVEELRREMPGLRCFLFANVAGNDTSRRYFEKVDARFRERDLGESITTVSEFLPEERLAALLHGMDVIVLPYSDYATRQISAAVKTAMSAERPIIVTDTFTFSDLDQEVLKIPDNSPPRIAGAVRDMLGNPGCQEGLIAAVQAYGRTNSLTQVAARHISVYKGL